MTVNFNLDGMALQTNPDYPYLPSPVDDSLPEVEPYDHQIETYETVLNNDEFFITNTSPTGSGKTYSWLTAAVEEELNVIAMYTTNALIVDQLQTVNEFLNNYRPDKDVATLLFTGDSLQQMRDEAPESLISNADAIERHVAEAFRKHDSVILFTNPDIFTQLRYLRYGDEPRRQTDRFDMVVFDEFHLADIKGQNTLLALFEDMYTQPDEFSATNKFMLLSATPEAAIQDRIQNRMNIPSFQINCDGGRVPLSQADGSNDGNWRSIMPALDIEFRPGDTFQTADDILDDDNFADIVDFCKQGRTVVMLDGVREVSRVQQALNEELPDSNVYLISGLNGSDIDQKLREFDVLVSNSAVEVGIDFDTEQVIYSGYSVDSFLQRIGRLRSSSSGFETKRAICYVPDHISRQMQKVKQTLVSPDDYVTRKRFEGIIKNAYPRPSRPKLFTPIYTALELYSYAVDRAENDFPGEEGREYLNQMFDLINRHCFEGTDFELTPTAIDDLITKANSRLVETTLHQYRGSDLSTLIYDTTEDEVKTYSLTNILRNYDVEFHTESEFLARIPEEHVADAMHESQYTTGYCTFHGRRECPDDVDEDEWGARSVAFIPSATLRNQLQKPPGHPDREPVVTTDLQLSVEGVIDRDNVPGLEHLNAELRDEPITCYALEGSTYDVAAEYDLGDFFFLHNLTNTRGTYSLATGLNALYLHCHDRQRNRGQHLVGATPADD